MTVVGPVDGVVPGQTFGGTLDANGQGRVSVRIRRLGTYVNTITITSKGGVVRVLTVTINVTAAASECP
jgi:hypothetical protein